MALFRTRRPHRRAGDAHRAAREWPLAAQAYRRHLADMPDDVAIWVQLGHAEKELGRLDEAEHAYEQASALAPADPDALLHLGHMLKNGRRYDAAFGAFARLYALAPTDETRRELETLASRRAGSRTSPMA